VEKQAAYLFSQPLILVDFSANPDNFLAAFTLFSEERQGRRISSWIFRKVKQKVSIFFLSFFKDLFA
jgi:hypothetical protein